MKTIVNYILMDIEATSTCMMTTCCTHTWEDLNNLDHLRLIVSLSYDVCSDSCCGNAPGAGNYKKIDWLDTERMGI